MTLVSSHGHWPSSVLRRHRKGGSRLVVLVPFGLSVFLSFPGGLFLFLPSFPFLGIQMQGTWVSTEAGGKRRRILSC